MKKIVSGICAMALAASFVVAGAAPSMSASMPRPNIAVKSDVTTVDHRWRGNGWNRGAYRGNWDGNRGHWRGRNRGRDVGIGVGAAIAGALITGAIINSQPRYVAPRRVYRSAGGNAHVQWCYNRYRSYRAYDNTFQPYHGPRQQCYSPY